MLFVCQCVCVYVQELGECACVLSLCVSVCLEPVCVRAWCRCCVCECWHHGWFPRVCGLYSCHGVYGCAGGLCGGLGACCAWYIDYVVWNACNSFCLAASCHALGISAVLLSCPSACGYECLLGCPLVCVGGVGRVTGAVRWCLWCGGNCVSVCMSNGTQCHHEFNCVPKTLWHGGSMACRCRMLHLTWQMQQA